MDVKLAWTPCFYRKTTSNTVDSFSGKNSLNHGNLLREFGYEIVSLTERVPMEAIVEYILQTMSSVKKPQAMFMMTLFSILAHFREKQRLEI